MDTTGLIWEEEEDRQLGATYWRFKISIRCVVQVYSGTLFSKEKFVNFLPSDTFKRNAGRVRVSPFAICMSGPDRSIQLKSREQIAFHDPTPPY